MGFRSTIRLISRSGPSPAEIVVRYVTWPSIAIELLPTIDFVMVRLSTFTVAEAGMSGTLAVEPKSPRMEDCAVAVVAVAKRPPASSVVAAATDATRRNVVRDMQDLHSLGWTPRI